MQTSSTYANQFYLRKPVLLTQASSTCASQKLIWIGLKKSRSDFFNPNKSAVLAYARHIWDTSHILFKWPWEKDGVIKRIGDDWQKPFLLTQASSTCASQKLIWLGLKKSRSDFFNPNKSAVLAYTSHIWDTSHILFKWPWEKEWVYKKNRWWLTKASSTLAILSLASFREKGNSKLF